MRIIGRSMLAAVVTAALSAGSANAAAVIIGDGVSAAYVRNADIGATRPVQQRLKGQTVKQGNAYIPRNTRFVITNVAPIDVSKLEEGDTVKFVLPEDFTVNDETVIRAGTEMFGVVKKAKYDSVFGGTSRLVIEVKEIATDAGVPVKLRCVVKDHAKGNIYFPASSEFIATTATDTDLSFAAAEQINF